ncbi:sensor domain-containing diguanylate cyclase [Saccharospirillum salsuginis]|uniref:diguanylate cyclase n=1 Tax=Saccharospirillum salsuginis TaxID=418750 RepID=A0A918KKE6_9GAMM|nr:GGDEF domain-containing protein [Saccharospirillum salsuginis]GGX66691.1 hypothetical protein GCM10007392_38050 [Saccharospirillum salsuginis]
MAERKRTIPRLTRVNYPPRVFGFGATFVAIGALVVDRDWSLLLFIPLTLFFLVYPHLIYLADRLRRANTSLEHRAMMFDAFMLGGFTALIEFSGWISYTLLAATILNNTMTGGLRQLRNAMALYLAGLGSWGLVVGFDWRPEAPLPIEILTMVSLQCYILSTAWVFYTQNRRLNAIKMDAQDKNTLFGVLLELRSLSDHAEDLDELVEGALRQFRVLQPDRSFGFVLRDSNRLETLQFAAFSEDMVESQRIWVLRRLVRARQNLPDGYYLEGDGQQNGYFVFTLHSPINLSQGLLLVQAKRLSETDTKTIGLLLDQLGTSLANLLLTQELKKAAERDALTGVYNRASLDRDLKAVESVRQHNPSIDYSVVLVDLIGLKRVNDHYGHEAGDRLISTVAEGLSAVSRRGDRVYRFGGDEFVILCQDSTLEGAQVLGERIDRLVRGREMTLETEQGGSVTVPIQLSLGVANSAHDPARELLKKADERMYADKAHWYETNARYR